MSNAPNYTPTVGFATEETNQVAGRSTVRTVAIDTEFANISSSINGMNSNLQFLQRDDGNLKDGIVQTFALSEATRALIASKGSPKGVWQPTTVYGVGDVVQSGVTAYLCYTAHTSGLSFDANGFWIAISGDGSSLANAQAAAISAAAALVSQNAALDSQNSALGSSTTASNAATTATNSATAAGNSATAAATSANAASNSATAAATSATNAINSPVAAPTNAAASKANPIDTDLIPLADSAASFGLKKLTLANLKAAFKSFFDPLYFARGSIAGLTLSTAGGSGTMSIAIGQAADSTNSILISLAVAFTKTTASWAVGSGNGGIDTGAIAANTWYYWFLIRRPDTGVVDVIFSLSSSAPTLPANYTQYRYIGGSKTDASSFWTAFTQVGDEFYWNTVASDFSGAGSTTAVTLTLTVPRGRKVKALLSGGITGAVGQIYVSDLANADQATSATSSVGVSGTATGVNGQFSCWTNTSGQIRYRNSNTNSTYFIQPLGWIDLRDRNI